MKNVLKRLNKLIALVMALSMVLLTACSSGTPATGSSADSKGTASTQSAKKKLVFWDKSEYVKDYNTLMKKKVDAFAKEKNVDVDYVIIPSNDVKQKVMAAIEAKNPPDLIVGDDSLCAQYVAMGQIADVSDVVSGMDLTDTAKEFSKINNKEVLVPLAFLAPGMYWRTDKWSAKGLSAPTTWQELKEQAKLVNDPTHGFYALGFPMGASGGGDAEGFMRSVILSFGGVPVDATGKVTINSPQTLEALKFVASLYQEGLCPPDAMTWDDSANNAAYLAGTVGVVFNSGSIWSSLKKEKPELLAKTQIISYPKGASGKSYAPGGTNTFGVFKTGKNTDVAKEFVKYYFSDKENYNAMVEAMGGMWQPVLNGMGDSAFWKKTENAGWLLNSKSLTRNFAPAPADQYANLTVSSQLCVKAIQNIVVNKMDPQAALDLLEKSFQKVYKDRK